MALNLVCAVLDRGPSALADMAVLLAIADSADKDSGEAWPSLATIAERSRQGRRNVLRVIARLRADGWLLSVDARTRANGSRQSSLYVLNLAKLGEDRQARRDAAPRAANAVAPVVRGVEKSPPPVTVGHQGGDCVSLYGGDCVSPLEPSHHLNLGDLTDFQQSRILSGNGRGLVLAAFPKGLTEKDASALAVALRGAASAEKMRAGFGRGAFAKEGAGL